MPRPPSAAPAPVRPRLNADWHRAHPMPPRATLEQRIAWHLDHTRHCGCRPMPASIRTALAAALKSRL